MWKEHLCSTGNLCHNKSIYFRQNSLNSLPYQRQCSLLYFQPVGFIWLKYIFAWKDIYIYIYIFKCA